MTRDRNKQMKVGMEQSIGIPTDRHARAKELTYKIWQEPRRLQRTIIIYLWPSTERQFKMPSLYFYVLAEQLDQLRIVMRHTLTILDIVFFEEKW